MANIENIPPTSSDSDNIKSKSKASLTSSDRKKLQTLQPSSKNQKLLVGRQLFIKSISISTYCQQVSADGQLGMSGSKPKKETIKVFEDPQSSSTSDKTHKHREVQATVVTREEESQVEETDTAQARAEDFMYGEEYPPEYWKELAEKTREALEKSLIENEELHTSLGLVEEEKEALKEENEGLREMAKQAEELAKIVKGLTADEDDEDDEDVETESEEEETQEESDKSNDELTE